MEMIEQVEEKTRKQQQPEDEDESVHSASEVEIVSGTTKDQTTQTSPDQHLQFPTTSSSQMIKREALWT
ncbi:hypothetical protein AVEN_93630-1, partial [Araneus ventricosus]